MLKLRRRHGSLLPMLLGVMVSLTGCGGGGGGGTPDPAPTPTLASGTYTGSVTTTSGGQSTQRPVVLEVPTAVGTAQASERAVALSSTTSTATYTESNGISGTATIAVQGTSLSISVQYAGSCAGSFSGSLTVSSEGKLSLSGTGTDCNGATARAGSISMSSGTTFAGAECPDVSGQFSAAESATVTCSQGGQSDTNTISGQAIVVLAQDQCKISYPVPGANASRSGQIVGLNLTLHGPFVLAAPNSGQSVAFTSNEAIVTGIINSVNQILLSGVGSAVGTINGDGFSCSGTSTAQFTRSSKCNFSSESTDPQRCFGGIGNRCKGDAPGVPYIKNEQTCQVEGGMSIGSIVHDNCCYNSPDGYNCKGFNTGSKASCYKEWQEAWFNTQCSVLGASRQWRVAFGPYLIGNNGDNTDINTNTKMRAPSGTKVNPDYQNLCSAGRCQVDAQGKTITKFDGCGNYCACQ